MAEFAIRKVDKERYALAITEGAVSRRRRDRGYKRRLKVDEHGYARFSPPYSSTRGSTLSYGEPASPGFEEGDTVRILPLPYQRWISAVWPQEPWLNTVFETFMVVNRAGEVRWWGHCHPGMSHVPTCRCPRCSVPEIHPIR